MSVEDERFNVLMAACTCVCKRDMCKVRAGGAYLCSVRAHASGNRSKVPKLTSSPKRCSVHGAACMRGWVTGGKLTPAVDVG